MVKSLRVFQKLFQSSLDVTGLRKISEVSKTFQKFRKHNKSCKGFGKYDRNYGFGKCFDYADLKPSKVHLFEQKISLF